VVLGDFFIRKTAHDRLTRPVNPKRWSSSLLRLITARKSSGRASVTTLGSSAMSCNAAHLCCAGSDAHALATPSRRKGCGAMHAHETITTTKILVVSALRGRWANLATRRTTLNSGALDCIDDQYGTQITHLCSFLVINTIKSSRIERCFVSGQIRPPPRNPETTKVLVVVMVS
jgi:hypothetical protein